MNTQSHKLTARLLAVLLTLATVLSLFLVYPFTSAYAAGTQSNMKPSDYLNQAYASAEEKWDTMGSEFTTRAGNYELRIDPVSTEIALKNCVTGEIQFSNAYDFTGVPSTIRNELMSTVVLSYQTPGSNAITTLYSFDKAVTKGQVSVKQQKNGFSVSYTMGDISRRYLAPMMIEASRFQTMILDKVTDASARRTLLQCYDLFSLNQGGYDQKTINSYLDQYPFLKEKVPADNEYYAKYSGTPYYEFYLPADGTLSASDQRKVQEIIRTYCPDYTFEELDYDHELTQYEAEKSSSSALFKLTLEYSLDAEGLRVTLPCNSIRFDETEYTLYSVKVLPFFGCGNNNYEGYSFIPDGSGALLDFQESKGKSVTLGGNEFGMIYGSDGAFYSANVRSTEAFRLPVFGLVEQHEDGADRGFFAVVEEGESMASITAQTDTRHPFQNVYATFYPRATDKTLLENAASGDKNAEYVLVADQKYTGDCTVRYFILNDKQTALNAGYVGYDCTYVGMAKLYRDYLANRGVLSRLTAQDVKEDLPLYVESFGVIDVQDTFLSIPITSKLPLTTFENLQTMYEELKAAGITNINFRLKGFTNGGMASTAPTNIKFESEVGGNDGYNAFVAYAKENGFGVFADFDFTKVQETSMGDDFSYSDDALRTIDNRYIRAKKYDPVYQMYAYTGSILVSPEAYLRMYEKFVGSMLQLDDHIGISVGTLGSNLNSDFDEDDPYTRVDAQALTGTMLSRLEAVFDNIMIDGGNAYALTYASHVLNVSLDSSHYQQASRTVPFVGMVLHGYVNFAGTATNMASEPGYETLKMIENGAAPYYILSYQNTNKLKDDKDLSDYYAVAYEYGKDDMMQKYHQMNGAIGDLQTVLISDHEFLVASRTPTEAEIEYDRQSGLTPEQIAAKYLVDDGSVVKVTYENGTYFYLNYNYFDVTVNGQAIGAMGYIKGTN